MIYFNTWFLERFQIVGSYVFPLPACVVPSRRVRCTYVMRCHVHIHIYIHSINNSLRMRCSSSTPILLRSKRSPWSSVEACCRLIFASDSRGDGSPLRRSASLMTVLTASLGIAPFLKRSAWSNQTSTCRGGVVWRAGPVEHESYRLV